MSNQTTNLTKDQAILAMLDGKKVRHRYFEEDEFIFLADKIKNIYEFENGLQASATMFWFDRRIEEWLTGWEII